MIGSSASDYDKNHKNPLASQGKKQEINLWGEHESPE